MIYILLGTGFEEIEAVSAGDILRRGGVETRYAAAGSEKTVAGAHGILITADLLAKDIVPAQEDRVVIPGGMGGVESITSDPQTMDLIASFAQKGAGLSAICAGPSVLAGLGLLDGREITCYPGCEDMMAKALCDASLPVRKDGSIITGRSPGAAVEFGLALLEDAVGAETAEKVRFGLVM